MKNKLKLFASTVLFISVLIGCKEKKIDWTGSYSYYDSNDVYYSLRISLDNNCIYQGFGDDIDFRVYCKGKSDAGDYKVYYEMMSEEESKGFNKPKKINKPILTLFYYDNKLYTETMHSLEHGGEGALILFKKEKENQE